MILSSVSLPTSLSSSLSLLFHIFSLIFINENTKSRSLRLNLFKVSLNLTFFIADILLNEKCVSCLQCVLPTEGLSQEKLSEVFDKLFVFEGFILIMLNNQEN